MGDRAAVIGPRAAQQVIAHAGNVGGVDDDLLRARLRQVQLAIVRRHQPGLARVEAFNRQKELMRIPVLLQPPAGFQEHPRRKEVGLLLAPAQIHDALLDEVEHPLLALAARLGSEAGQVGLEIGQGEQAGAHMRLQQAHQGLQVFPVRAVVAGEQQRGVEAQDFGHADVVADVFEVHPGGHGGQPAALDLAHPLRGPGRVAAQVVDVPIVGWGNDAAVGLPSHQVLVVNVVVGHRGVAGAGWRRRWRWIGHPARCAVTF